MKRKKYLKRHEPIFSSPEEQKLWEIYKEKRENLIWKYNSKCYICGRTKRLEFHHFKHHEDEGIAKSTLQRRVLILEEIEKYPEDFILLCYACHECITWLKTLNEEEQRKLVAVLQATF